MPERFIKPLLIEISISMLIWILFWIIFSNSKKAKGEKISVRVEIKFFLFYIYAVSVLSLTIIPLPFKRFRKPNEYGINIIPLVNTFRGLLEIDTTDKIFSDYNFQNIAGNIVLFFPFGIFLPLLSARYRTIGRVTVLACICSASIELTQLISRHFQIYRTVDIDDVILNTSGAILGFAVIKKWYFNKDKSIKKAGKEPLLP